MPKSKRLFRVRAKINLSRMGSARNKFSRLNLEFSKTEMGKRLLEEIRTIEAPPKSSILHKISSGAIRKSQEVRHIGAMMDYYNRLLFFAKEKGASGAVISYLGLHVRELEKEYEKFALMD